MRGRKLQQARHRLFSQQPFCVRCLEQGLYVEATIRDHIVPLFEGGEDVETNTQPLCQDCSDGKTAEESARGRRRMAGG